MTNKRFFEPAVGCSYDDGIYGHKVLVLGESHYSSVPGEATPFLTQEVVEWYNNLKKDKARWFSTFTKFSRALSGQLDLPRGAEENKKLWEKIIFYNYVQEPMTAPRQKPTKQQYRDADKPFFDLLEEKEPDRVIVWGKRLYYNRPLSGLKNYRGEDCGEEETWVYELSNGHRVQVLPIWHPSSAFSPAKWSQIIDVFLKRD